MTAPRTLSIMGSTGSIGTSALSVISHANAVAEAQGNDPIFAIEALVAGHNVHLLAQQARELRPRRVVVADERQHSALVDLLAGTGIDVAAGQSAVRETAQVKVDRVLAAIVGIAGLSSTLAAIEAGNSVALANKESMVCAGPLLNRLARAAGVAIVPTDSEHNAMFQVMERHEDVERLVLTASGGPFRCTPADQMANATPAMALAHPRWEMGQKISIDSATLFNKGLELIEAVYLFDIPESQIDVVVHPQSIVHSLVAYRDGSVLAQMGEPDMRTPILHALTWPERRQPAPVKRLDLVSIGKLDFHALDAERFPAINLAREAVRLGDGAPAVLNCANEGAVAAFLAGKCRFGDISWVVEKALDAFVSGAMAKQDCDSFEAIMALEAEARDLTSALLAKARARGHGA